MYQAEVWPRADIFRSAECGFRTDVRCFVRLEKLAIFTLPSFLLTVIRREWEEVAKKEKIPLCLLNAMVADG